MDDRVAVVAGLMAAGWLGGLVHELAHAVVACTLGLRVREARVGMGPSLRFRVAVAGQGFPLLVGLVPLIGWCRLDDAQRASPGRRVAVYLSGPAANLAVAVIAGSVAPWGSWLSSLALVNLALFLVSLMPVPACDGWLVLRALLDAVAGGGRPDRVSAAMGVLAAWQGAVLVGAIAGKAFDAETGGAGAVAAAAVGVAMFAALARLAGRGVRAR